MAKRVAAALGTGADTLDGIWAESLPPHGSARVVGLFFKSRQCAWFEMEFVSGEPMIGHKAAQYNVKVNSDRIPKEIDFSGGQKPLLGIYDINGNTLRLQFGRANKRPKSFRATSAWTLKKQRSPWAGISL
jgi:hypothetical protein